MQKVFCPFCQLLASPPPYLSISTAQRWLCFQPQAAPGLCKQPPHPGSGRRLALLLTLGSSSYSLPMLNKTGFSLLSLNSFPALLFSNIPTERWNRAQIWGQRTQYVGKTKWLQALNPCRQKSCHSFNDPGHVSTCLTPSQITGSLIPH